MGQGAVSTPRAVILDPNDGGLAMARSLARRGIPVVVLSNPSEAWVGHSRGVTGIELPNLAGAEPRWIEQIIELGAGGDGVLVPCSDRACELLARHRAEIPTRLRSFESPQSAHLRLMNKASLYEAAEEAGIRHPWWRILRTERDIDTIGAQADYPCLLKPTLSHEWRRLFGLERVFLIESPGALADRARPAIAAGLELMLTEHVAGPETNLEAHVALRLADGSYPVDYTRRKLRQYPLDFGAGATVMSAHAPATRALSQRLLDSVGFVGVAQTETKLHPKTGEPVLIEVNVRVPRDWGLGDAAGTDVSYRLYGALAGLPLGPPPAARNGVKIVVPALEVRAARDRLRAGDIGFLELLRSYRGVRELGPLDLRDPMPAVALGARMIRDRVRSLRG
jgi:D-aspartate ligase